MAVKVNSRLKRRQEDANESSIWSVFSQYFCKNFHKQIFDLRRTEFNSLLCCNTSRRTMPLDGFSLLTERWFRRKMWKCANTLSTRKFGWEFWYLGDFWSPCGSLVTQIICGSIIVRAVQHVFSLFRNKFDKQINYSKEDYIETSLMLHFNQRTIPPWLLW